MEKLKRLFKKAGKVADFLAPVELYSIKLLRRLRNVFAFGACSSQQPSRDANSCPQSVRSAKAGSLLFGSAPVEFARQILTSQL